MSFLIKNKVLSKSIVDCLLFFSTLLIIFGTAYYLKYRQLNGQTQKLSLNPNAFYSLQKPKLILVAGCDQEYEMAKNGYMAKVKNSFKGRTDTILLVKFDPVQKKISALNIPRDTRIFINGHRSDKINSLNTLGGPELLKEVLEDLFEIEIDNYILVNTNSIEKIIDQAGGISVDIPKKMVYHDKTDGLNIDFEAGPKVLKGKEAVGFLRFRHDSLGDIGRIQRQQAFLRAIKGKLADPSLIGKLPQITSTALESVQTDLVISDILKLANFVRIIPADSQIFATLPGDFSVPEQQTKIIYETVSTNTPIPSEEGENPDSLTQESVNNTTIIKKVITYNAPFISYWLPDEAEIVKVIDRLFGSGLEETEIISKQKIKIAIENSTNNKKVVSVLSKLLREKGYQIVDIANSYQKEQTSSIYAQKANLQEAKFIHSDLQMPTNVRIRAGSIASPLADIGIMIGPELVKSLLDEKQEISKKENAN